MSTAARPAPSISLIVRWPHSTAAALGKQLLRRLNDRAMAATWAIEHPAQAATLSQAEIAMLIGMAWRSEADAIASGIETFRKAGRQIALIQCNDELPRENIERRLSQAGVRSIVAGVARTGVTEIRPLPFGVTRLTPHVAVPARRGWLGLLRRRQAPLVTESSSLGIAVIELSRIDSAGTGAWREIEQLLGQIEELRQSGARIGSVSEILAALGVGAPSRPQHSILRKAA